MRNDHYKEVYCSLPRSTRQYGFNWLDLMQFTEQLRFVIRQPRITSVVTYTHLIVFKYFGKYLHSDDYLKTIGMLKYYTRI